MITCKKYCKSLISLMICTLIFFSTVTADIAVVVRKDSSIENLTSEELAYIYLGTITSLSNRKEIKLFEYTDLSESFYDHLLDMSPTKFKKHWMKLVFSGAYARPPIPLKNQPELVKNICESTNGLGFMNCDSIPKYLKAIAVNSLYPGELGYYFSDDSL